MCHVLSINAEWQKANVESNDGDIQVSHKLCKDGTFGRQLMDEVEWQRRKEA